MKEKDSIYQLKQLKRLQLSESGIADLKKRVFRAANFGRAQSRGIAFFRPPAFIYAAVSLIIIVLVLSVFRQDFLFNTQEMVVKTQMFFSNNRLSKASIALGLSKEQLADLKESNTVEPQLSFLAAATSQTDFSLRNLKLMGEKGRYSREQCLDVYRNYQKSLEETKQELLDKLGSSKDTAIQKKLKAFLKTVDRYETVAKARLQLYKN